MTKQYAAVETYEKKLQRVMERFGVTEYDYNWDRHGGHVVFKYKGEYYRFEYTVEMAKQRGKAIKYGTDAFAKVVLSLERLALMVEDGIYDLSTWIVGMKALPPSIEIPTCFRFLQFTEIPKSANEVTSRYRELSKTMHPDVGGNEEDFKNLQKASDEAIKWFQR